jgi:hypothetical protein
MYCPQCGQQQVSDVARFCPRCGFLLEGVAAVIASGGMMPRYFQPGSRRLSPKSKGIRQGALLMLSTLLVVPIISILSVFFLGNPEVIIPITALVCFVGGLLRIIYALLMEDSTPAMEHDHAPAYSPPATPQLDNSARNFALPPGAANAATGWRQRPNTAEIYQPPSITENTTRLLDKDDPKGR